MKQFDEPVYKASVDFQKHSSLLFPEGRAVQQYWVGASCIEGGIITNIVYGLTTFNSFVRDHSNIYENRNSGFLDPLTGIFLWVGISVLLFNFFKKNKEEHSLLILGGFLFYLFVFSFVVNKSPNYTRLLVTLPFVCYLAVVGLDYISGLAEKLRNKLNLKFCIRPIVFFIFLAVIVCWNSFILYDYNEKNIDEGNTVGGQQDT